MPVPAYMWLKDDGGADIKGSVDVQEREGSIEISTQMTGMYGPEEFLLQMLKLTFSAEVSGKT